MKGFSLLELLHPDGSASTSCVLGNNCPENLFPESQTGPTPKVELLILAPRPEECRSEGWLEAAVEFIGQHLSEDGVGYVLAPFPWRQKILRLLRQANFVIDASFWHFPDWATSYYLVPLEHIPARFAVKAMIPAPFWKRILAREMFRYSGGRQFLAAFWEAAGVSVRRTGSRPLFQWLFKQEHEQVFRGTAILRRSWRGVNGASILYCFSENDLLPSAIAKTTLAGSSITCPEREAEALEELGPGARNGGAQIPRLLRKEQNDRFSSLYLSPLQGQPISDLLESNSDLWSTILPKVVDWLERWHLATVTVRPLEVAQLEQALLTPLDLLAPFLQGYEKYRGWLVDQIRAVVGVPMPFVATHNDLTMVNILLDEQDRLGILDWETGQAESWPLADFHYAVTDSIRIAAGCADWLEAFKASYLPDGLYALQAASWRERLRTAIGISPSLAELCFHACWLHHASNEQRSHQDGDPQPFLQIVQWLVLRHSEANENRN